MAPTAAAELAEHGLLNRPPETGLGSAGDGYSAMIKRLEQWPHLSPDAQSELAGAVLAAREQAAGAGGRRARDLEAVADLWVEALVGANIRLIIIICREQATARWGAGAGVGRMPDLVAEAFQAAMEAVRAWRPDRGPAFPTWLARIVRDRVRSAVSGADTVRITTAWSRMRRIAHARRNALQVELGRAPTLDELRQDITDYCREWAARRIPGDLDPETFDRMVELKLRKQGMLAALDHLEDILAVPSWTVSLDRSVGDSGTALVDLVGADPGAEEAFEVVDLGLLRAEVERAMADLPERSREILRLRYGLGDPPGEPMTYSAIAQRFGISAERVRQLERSALERVRRNGGAGWLVGWLVGSGAGDTGAGAGR